MSICFLFLFFIFIDLSNFHSNQTKPKKKKKFPNLRKQITRNIFSCWSLCSILYNQSQKKLTPTTIFYFLFFILINNNNIKKFICINIVVGACGFLWVRYVLVMGSHKKSHPHPPSSSSPSSSQLVEHVIGLLGTIWWSLYWRNCPMLPPLHHPPY